jgi:hypothetical protein
VTFDAGTMGAFVGSAVTAGLALWRALHADKAASRAQSTASRVETITEVTDKRLAGGAQTFAELQKTNLYQAAQIAENKARISLLENRVLALEHALLELRKDGT